MVILGVLLGLGSCLLWGMCGMKTIGKTGSAGGTVGDGYWNNSCVTGDGTLLAAGGDHAAVIDLATGKVLERHASQVKAIGCEEHAAVIVAYDGAWRFPGKTAVSPAPDPAGTVVALSPKGEWIAWTRTLQGRGWRGPATVLIGARRLDLLPALFGKVGEGKQLPLPDTFAVRFGGLLEDGRLLVGAGWQPSQSGGSWEDVPWGLFAVNLNTGDAAGLTLPLKTDARLNQSWMQKVASTPDASVMAVATHDGTQLWVATFAQGADAPTRVTGVPAKGGPNALAVSADGSLVAVGSEGRGRDAPAFAAVIDQAGKVIWRAEFAKTVTGVHFLGDGSLVVTSAEARALRVALPQGHELWHTP